MDPITISLLVGAGIGGVKSLLSGNQDEERKNAIINYLKQNRLKVQQDYEKRKSNMLRLMEQEKKQRRGAIANKYASMGISGPTTIFSNEEPIINAGYKGISDIGSAEDTTLQSIDDQIAQAGFLPSGESDVSRVLGGMISGANMGAGFGKSLGFLDPKATGGGLDTTISKDNPTNSGKLVPDMMLNTQPGAGGESGEDDISSILRRMMLKNKKKKSDDDSGFDWGNMEGMFNPNTSFNNVYRLQ